MCYHVCYFIRRKNWETYVIERLPSFFRSIILQVFILLEFICSNVVCGDHIAAVGIRGLKPVAMRLIIIRLSLHGWS